MNTSDKGALEDFLSRAAKLQECGYFKNYKKRSVNLEWSKQEGGGKMQSGFPTDEEVHAVVNILRPFMLQEQNIYFPSINSKLKKVCKQIGKNEWLEPLDSYRTGYENAKQISPIGFKLNTETIDFEEIFEAFMYGEYAKNDADKRKKLKRWESLNVLQKFTFFNALDNIAECIRRTANVYFLIRKDHTIRLVEQAAASQ